MLPYLDTYLANSIFDTLTSVWESWRRVQSICMISIIHFSWGIRGFYNISLVGIFMGDIKEEVGNFMEISIRLSDSNWISLWILNLFVSEFSSKEFTCCWLMWMYRKITSRWGWISTDLKLRLWWFCLFACLWWGREHGSSITSIR